MDRNFVKLPLDGNDKIDLSRVVFSGQYEDSEEIKKLVIPEGVEEICENAFRGYSSIEEIELPSSLKQISACASFMH